MSEETENMPKRRSSDNPTWSEGRTWKNAKAIFSVARWTIAAVFLALSIYYTQRETNAQQTVSVADVQKEQVAIRKEMDSRSTARDKQMERVLTREVFEAYHSADMQRMDRIEKLIEQIAQRP